eukprot:8392900-Heterocapsa_arctica.AAC.1
MTSRPEMEYLQQIDASGKAVEIMVIRYLCELVYQIKHESAYTSGSGLGSLTPGVQCVGEGPDCVT